MTARTTASVLLLLTGLTAALDVFDAHGPVRLVATLAFFLLVPGWSVLAFFRPGTSSTTWALAIAVSVAIDLLGGQLMLMTGQWYPAIASICLLSICAILLVAHMLTASRGAA